MKKIVVLASGRGSNFRAVFERTKTPDFPSCRISLLITDRPNTGAQDYAQANGIPVSVIDYKQIGDKAVFDDELQKLLAAADPDLILTAGYMRILNPNLVRAYRGRIINIHPSLLPSFPGMHAQKQALEYGVRVTGATVHFIDEGMDTGPIIMQAPVFVDPDMDVESLSLTLLKTEHRILCEAVSLFLQERLKLEGRKVTIIDRPSGESSK